MRMVHSSVVLLGVVAALFVLAGCGGEGTPYEREVAAIAFSTETVPDGGAGQIYYASIAFNKYGGAADPDRFTVVSGVLPPGIALSNEREDADGDGLPDPDGDLTGCACLLGYPREPGSYTFTLKAIAAGPTETDLSAEQTFTIQIGEGSIAVLNPTAKEGTADPAVPAFPEVIDFVNPSNPQAFFSFSFQVAGGSRDRLLRVYLPRELELSVFDRAVADGIEPLSFDSIEAGNAFDPDFSDGGWFSLQAGTGRVQIGGFQSPRGRVGTITQSEAGPGLDPRWFQRTPADGGPALNSRRDFDDTQGLAGGDSTLGTPQPILFSDYFDPQFEGTDSEFGAPPLTRRKYPFPADQYENAFLVGYTPGVDITPLRYRAIVEAVDRRGTDAKADDLITRRAYVVQVKIPDIRIDTVALPDGTCGIDYTEFVNASGGVPPLSFDLEWVDGNTDWQATAGDPLDQEMLGVELDLVRGQFFGVPRNSGTVELTVRVYADVMNPIQGGGGFLPTGGTVGEYVGTHPLTGEAGVHKTFRVAYAAPSAPTIVNGSLRPGVDGQAYGGDQLTGAGGVPLLTPDPVGFTTDYPASQARRTYGWAATYERDTSHGAGAGTVDPDRALPNALVLDGDPDSASNGEVTGIPYDRGFHPITVVQTDSYFGDAASPDRDAFRQQSEKVLTLSVSPDSATYLRGVPSADKGEPTGLLEPTKSMGEALMVPMFLQAGFYSAETGKQPQLYSSTDISRKLDILPVMLTHGGTDEHVEKNIPSVTGFWPAESGSLDSWQYYYYGGAKRSWKHLQQEFCWLQTPRTDQARVFLWADTVLEEFDKNSYYDADKKLYQQYDENGKRGVMVMNPLTGDFWFPAVLDNRDDDSDGSQFGAECKFGAAGYSPSYSIYPYYYAGYWRYYTYGYYMRGDREALLQGLGSFLEAYTTNTSSGKTSQGRGAVSVAMSADGLWCATVMPGGDEPKLLLWRTDKQPIPSAILSNSYVTALNGLDANGDALANSACIFSLGGEYAGSEYISTNQRYLMPDSLMFVEDGLLFQLERSFDYVFGLSLVDGHLSSRYLNSRTEVSSGQGTGPYVNSSDGQYVADQDYLRGVKGDCDFSSQFIWAGNDPAAGEEGPNRIAFVAGDNYRFYAMDDWGGYAQLPDQVRDGYGAAGNYAKALLYLELSTSAAAGLDLDASTLKDLTGNDRDVYGDLLTPGRPGEELDYLAVSPDGKYVAVVRDINDSSTYSYYYYGRAHTYHTDTSSSTYAYYQASDDLLLCSTDGTDLDTRSGTQTVLFLGTDTYSSSYSGTPAADTASYASAEPYVNAKGRRINALRFTPDSRTLIFQYAGDNTYWTKLMGYTYQAAINAHPSQYSGYRGLSAQMSIRWHFRTGTDGAIDYDTDSSDFLKNNMDGLSEKGIGAAGPTTAPFTETDGSTGFQFWSTFESENGDFLYYVVDQIDGRNFLVGLNLTSDSINGHPSFEPFVVHGESIGFEQFDCSSWNYENRFFAVPAGTTFTGSGRDGAGIVFVIGSDASAGATSDTDLEVYVFDSNLGTDLVPLTADVTGGTANAINHLYASADGNVLVGQICRTTANSDSGRSTLNGKNDLFCVSNVHAVLAGAAPDAFLVSEEMSHGATVAFVGEGTVTGPQAIVFSSAESGGNSTWDDRTLKIGVLAPGGIPSVLDSTESHYIVLSGSRKVDDDWQTGQ